MNEYGKIFSSCTGYPERRTCMLMVTHGCNLNCTYCYEKFKNAGKKMSLELAMEIISREMAMVKESEQFTELEVDFMGGEPLLRFDLIKAVVEWLESEPQPVPYICFATTNATLLTDEMKEWFRQHRRTIMLGASYDGLASLQSENRGEKSTHVDLEFFKELWPEQGFKMTISKESLPYLFESLKVAAERDYRLDASLAQGEDWNLHDAEIYLEQLRKLKDYYLENMNLMPSNLLTRMLVGLGERRSEQLKFCGSGVHMCTYDVDGTKYGCHMFTPIVLNERALPLDKFDGWDDGAKLTDRECEGCGMSRWCPTCIGFNMLTRGDVTKRDRRWCAMMAVQAIVCCEYQLEAFSKFIPAHDLNEEGAKVVSAALSAYEYLKNVDFRKPFPQ